MTARDPSLVTSWAVIDRPYRMNGIGSRLYSVRNIALQRWDVGEDEAKQIQFRLASLVVFDDDFTSAGLIGGVSIRPLDEAAVQIAVCVLNLRNMKTMDAATATANSPFPYIPGLRAFQAGQAIIAAFEKLRTLPDLVLWDGHGIAHPRRCGLASHLGVLLDIPSVGLSEELLYGTCNSDALPKERASHVPVLDPENGTQFGVVLRTHSAVRPMYISIGHRVSLESAIRIVLECTPRYRMPEPLRQARMLCKRVPR